MEIVSCREEDYDTLAGIWERSVRATHFFLTEEAINEIRASLVPCCFPAVELYAVTDNGITVGFIGLRGETIEMLFVDSTARGKGYGSALMDLAKRKGATKVDVNEQNPLALRFYQAKGFHVVAREERDEAGRPYPILSMSL